jgi:hypothetical protein
MNFHDGPKLGAWWEAKIQKPETWEEFVNLEYVRFLSPETQKEIWRLLGRSRDE